MKILFSTFFLLLSVKLFSQTCVIAVIDSSAITIGADTKVGRVLYNTATNHVDTLSAHARKFYTVGRFNYALIGDHATLQKPIVDSLARIYNTVSDLITAYKKEFGDKLLKELLDMRKEHYIMYKYFFDNSRPYMDEIVFCGFENHKPYIVTLAFHPEENARSLYIGVRTASSNEVIAGEEPNNSSVMADKKTWEHGSIEAIKYILKIVAHDHPKSVSEPFDIFVITDAGTKEITNNPYKSLMDK